MNPLPTTQVTSVTREQWITRAKNVGDFCDLTHDQQEQLARAFGETIDPNLNTLGRMEWATVIERRLQEGWAMPASAPTVGFASIMGMHASETGRKL